MDSRRDEEIVEICEECEDVYLISCGTSLGHNSDKTVLIEKLATKLFDYEFPKKFIPTPELRSVFVFATLHNN